MLLFYIMDYFYKYIKYKYKYLNLYYEINNINNNNLNNAEMFGGGKNKLNKYKIISELGSGVWGTTYLVQNAKYNKYAMKIEHIFEDNIKKSYKSLIWREKEFAQFMYKKHPLHFMKLIDDFIINDCKLEKDLTKIQKRFQSFYKKIYSSPYCSIKIWSLIDLTLKEFVDKKFDNEIYYDIFIQIIYVMTLINKYGYIHGDFKMDNIGLNKTKDKYIIINNKKIPTNGYYVVLIDYGNIMHKKYISRNKFEKNAIETKNDIYFMFDRIEYNLIYNFYDFEAKYNNQINTYNPIKINITHKKILKEYLPNEVTKNNEKELMQHLYKIIYYEDFEKNILKKNIKKIIKPKLYLPLDTITFIIKNINNLNLILEHLIQKYE